jgi:hypothetical protein
MLVSLAGSCAASNAARHGAVFDQCADTYIEVHCTRRSGGLW